MSTTPEETLPRTEEITILSSEAVINQVESVNTDETVAPLLRREVEATCDWITLVRHPRRRELFEAVANDPDHEVGIYEMLRKAERDVAWAAKDLKIGRRTESERRDFLGVLGKYSDYMREVLWFEIGQTMEDASAGFATRQAITHVRSSHASIIKQEGEERLAHSRMEQFKETVAATPKRRLMGRVAIGATQIGAPILIGDYVFNQILPEAAQEEVLAHINTGNIAAIAIALVVTGLKAGTKFGSDSLLERVSRTFRPYMPWRKADTEETAAEQEELLFTGQVERQKQLLVDLNGFMAESRSSDNPYCEEFVEGLVQLIVIALRHEYLGEEKDDLRLRLIRGAGRSATVGAVRLLGLKDPEAQDFAESLFADSEE